MKRLLNFNSSRERLYLENKAFAKAVPEGSLVLDAGAGNQPYKFLFEHAKYESADFEQVDKSYAKSTYVCNLDDIPVEDNRYDFILFNQVMEHLPDPSTVLKELFRILKPSGKILYTGPLFYEEHEQPFDFYRYTQFGLRKLFTDAHLNIERLDWLEGYFGTIAYQFRSIYKYLPLKPKKIGNGFTRYLVIPLFLLVKLTSLVLSILFHKLEMKYKFCSKGYPKNYIAILKK